MAGLGPAGVRAVSFEEQLEVLVERVVRRVVREEMQPELLTPAQAGALVGRSPKTICQWIREERLTRHGPGKPLVSRKEVLALQGAPRRARTRAPSAESEARRLAGGH